MIEARAAGRVPGNRQLLNATCVSERIFNARRKCGAGCERETATGQTRAVTVAECRVALDGRRVGEGAGAEAEARKYQASISAA